MEDMSIKELEDILDKKRKGKKKTSFLDVMIKTVFISTFIFTAVSMYFAYTMGWESMMTTLVERWFTIMVGEIIVTGAIQIFKVVVQAKVNKEDK